MQLPEFAFISNMNLPGGEYIISTRAPYWILRTYRFENAQAEEAFIIKHNLLNECARVPGYNMLIAYIGTIDGVSETPVLGHNVPQEVKNIFNPLIQFYEKNRIAGNESRLKKFAKA